MRARAHKLQPCVMIGHAGLTPAVLNEIDRALKSHELIKVRILGENRAARERAIHVICNALHASPVQVIGRMIVVYRPAPEPEQTVQATLQRNRRSNKKSDGRMQ
jgi:RNA-binding protein